MINLLASPGIKDRGLVLSICTTLWKDYNPIPLQHLAIRSTMSITAPIVVLMLRRPPVVLAPTNPATTETTITSLIINSQVYALTTKWDPSVECLTDVYDNSRTLNIASIFKSQCHPPNFRPVTANRLTPYSSPAICPSSYARARVATDSILYPGLPIATYCPLYVLSILGSDWRAKTIGVILQSRVPTIVAL